MAHARGDERLELRGHPLARLAMVLPHSHFGNMLQCVATHSSKLQHGAQPAPTLTRSSYRGST